MYTKTYGFTLIELMVVMLIMASLLSLVGGVGVKGYESAQKKTELMTLSNTITALSYQAFSSGRQIEFNFKGHAVEASYSPKLDNESVLYNKIFEYIFFQPQKFVFNKNGFAFPSEIRAQTGNVNHLLDINSIIVKSNSASTIGTYEK